MLRKVGPAIADQVADATLGHRRTLDTRQSQHAGEVARRQLRFERELEKELRRRRFLADMTPCCDFAPRSRHANTHSPWACHTHAAPNQGVPTGGGARRLTPLSCPTKQGGAYHVGVPATLN